MQVNKTENSKTNVTLLISAVPSEMKAYKTSILKKMAKVLKVPGFRIGKVPLDMAEKHLSEQQLQSEFIELAVNELYSQALNESNLRPAGDPKISLKKFVPFNTLEFTAQLDIIGKIKLPDYHKMRIVKDKDDITPKDISQVLESLRLRQAERTPKTGPAELGDEVIIDFKGLNEKNEPIKSAANTDFPLVLGSSGFIAGFEENIIGMKTNETTEFTTRFPKNYGVPALNNKKVRFSVVMKKLNKLDLPELDDKFATLIGPFKNLSELKEDIKYQLGLERESQLNKRFQEKVIRELIDKTDIDLPVDLVEAEANRLAEDIKKSIINRGQTWQAYLEAEQTNEKDYMHKILTPEAVSRLKAGIIIGEIAELEKVQITPLEFKEKIEDLKNQYKDPAMRAELDDPKNQRDLLGRMIADKTITMLSEMASKAK